MFLIVFWFFFFFFFSSRRRHTRCSRDWSSDVCSSDLAFREPDAAGRAPEVPAVRLDRGAELQVDRLVAREQRQVAVGRRAGDDLHVARPLEIGEGPGDVAADPTVHLPHPLEERLPEVGEADNLLLALAGELLA